MSLLEHLNLYFGYEAETMDEFIEDFKDEFQVKDDKVVATLLMSLSSYNKTV